PTCETVNRMQPEPLNPLLPKDMVRSCRRPMDGARPRCRGDSHTHYQVWEGSSRAWYYDASGVAAGPESSVGWRVRLGPRLRTSSRRMRSSNSMGAYIPLGRKTSAGISSWLQMVILPENKMAGVWGESF